MRNDYNNIKNNDIDTIYDYLLNIKNFEETLNKTSVFKIYEKDYYIINLLDYYNFKEQIKYKSLVEYITNKEVCKTEINKYLNNYEIIMDKIEKIRIVDLTNFEIEKIFSEQYKIINETLAKVICYWEKEDVNNYSIILYNGKYYYIVYIPNDQILFLNVFLLNVYMLYNKSSKFFQPLQRYDKIALLHLEEF